jgi:hypothetical protein
LACLHLGGADVVEGMDEDLGLAEPLGQLDRAIAPGQRLVGVGGQHGELGQVAVGHGQLRAGGKAFQQLDGLPPGALGVGVAALEPGQARQPAQRVAFLAPVPQGPPAAQRPLLRRARLGQLVGQVALVGMALEQVGPRRLGQPVGEPQCPRVLGGRLPVGAEGGRPAGRHRGVLEHGGGVAGPVGMVGQPRRVWGGPWPGQEGGQGAAVQLGPAAGRQRLLHGQAGQLVPEADAAGLPLEHPGGHALVHLDRCSIGRLGQQPGLDRRGHHRGGVQDLPGLWGQPGRPGQHCVHHGGRDRRIAGCEDLGDEEGIPPGPLVQRDWVHPVRAGQHGHRLAGQGRQPQPADQGRAGKVAGEQPHGMLGPSWSSR